MRCGRAGLHGDPLIMNDAELAAADARFHAPARAGGAAAGRAVLGLGAAQPRPPWA